MANITVSSLDPVLKQLYVGQAVEDLCYKDHALLATLPKREDFEGRNMPIPIKYARGAGRSATFATAQTNASSPSWEDFLLTRVSDYAVAGIDGEALEASQSDKGSFVRGLKSKIDDAFGLCSNSLAIDLFRDGSGAIGVDSGWSTPSAATTLATTEDVSNFEVGQVLKSATGSTGAVDTGSVTVLSINRTTGVVTMSAAIDSGIAAFAASDTWFVEGDAHNNVSYKKVSGLGAWVPASAPGATAFFGVARNVDTRLGGQRLDASAYATIEDAIIDAASIVAAEGGSVSHFFLHPVKFRMLIKELGSKVQYDKLLAQSAKGEIAHMGFRSVVLDGDKGPVQVTSDYHCVSTYGWGLQMDSMKLCTLGKAPKILMQDGLRIQRQATADGYEVRTGYYGNLACNAPSRNIIVTLP